MLVVVETSEMLVALSFGWVAGLFVLVAGSFDWVNGIFMSGAVSFDWQCLLVESGVTKAYKEGFIQIFLLI